MPIEEVKIENNPSRKYYLICFDENGNERKELDGSLLSSSILNSLSQSQSPITDIFLMSHGWKGDVPAAKKQYHNWITAMIKSKNDHDISQIRPGFNPLLIGIHWPSLVWGNENLDAQPASFDTKEGSAFDELIEQYAIQVSDTEVTRDALRTIFAAGLENDIPPDSLPPEVLNAYQILIQEASANHQGEDPDEWSETESLNLDPENVYQATLEESRNKGVSFGIGDFFGSTLNKFLELPRLISFWRMKNLAREIGQKSGFTLLKELQKQSKDVRFHLMGHSFGCIVVSASLAGNPKGDHTLERPVNSLALVQGALSLWAYCAKIPFRENLSGYFYPIIADRKVNGPIITTQSDTDNAVGKAYPIAGTLGMVGGQDIDFAVKTDYPRVGAIGTFGIQGGGLEIENMEMKPVDKKYTFEKGKIYNLDGSKYIRVDNPDPFFGSHSAIDKPEVAHAVWSAALAELA